MFKYLKTSDKYLLVLSVISSIYGLIIINTATASYGSDKYLRTQMLAICIGVICFIFVSMIDVDQFKGIWKPIYLFNILLQLSLIPLGVGEETTGHNAWIRFGTIGFQPAEIGKIIFIFTLAMHISLIRERINNICCLLSVLIHTGIVVVVVVYTSSDMGMALAYLVILVIMLFIAGLSYKWFLAGFLSLLVLIPVVWNYILDGYHKIRILVLFDPTLDPDKAYQGLQSKTAIGSGGIFGTGYLEGSLTQYNRLPAKHTDFIFAVVGEEFGFIGALLVVVLISLLIARIFYVCLKAPTEFSALICAGIGGMLLFQTVQNIFMCLGVTPVIGLTLPFFSYGGTSVVTMFISVGIVAGIRSRETPSHLKFKSNFNDDV